jgi:Anti-sigma-K factor rskA/Putative zinc-finger
MAVHEEFLELCAARTAGELTPAEESRLEAHLGGCRECREAMAEYELASREAVAAVAQEVREEEDPDTDSWSVEEAEKAFFRRLDGEKQPAREPLRGQRFTYRPSEIRSREIWMPFAAAVLLALALGIAAYRTGVKRGTEVAGSSPPGTISLEEQVSDAGHERAQLLEKLAEQDRRMGILKSQLAEQQKAIAALKAAPSPSGKGREETQELATAQAKLSELTTTIDTLSGQREGLLARASTLEARVSELTEQVRDREQELDEKQGEVRRQQDLLDRDRDIRELVGARDLYIAEVRDVAGSGQTSKTYGRVFYTKGKRLVFYAYDLDAQPGVENASTFQAWGRRGPDKQQALNLGIFYEDNAGKKRWVLKANDPKSLDDIDAVFVTIEPNGGSHHPSGKPLLFAYLRVSPNHP